MTNPNPTPSRDPRASKSFTGRDLRCSTCGKGPRYAKDRSLEQTGVCADCAARAGVAR